MHKNQFGHVLIVAGSPQMLGAAALTGLAAMRCGAGLVTLGIPASLNDVIQKKISPVLMTLPLKETREHTVDTSAYLQIKSRFEKFNVIALGPGLSQHPKTIKFIHKMVAECPKPMVIDADGLNALSQHTEILKKKRGVKILTPHSGEMARLIGKSLKYIGSKRRKVAVDFARQFRCVLLLKGHRTVIASADGKVHVNQTGNPGMATAGSGDVLTGMIAALLAQGLSGFEAAKWGAYLHGKAGDWAASQKTPTAMIATDIIDHIPQVINDFGKPR